MPLFEKVLSASDAGRIGRLVLPKACAEVSVKLSRLYFSPHVLFPFPFLCISVNCKLGHVQAFFPPISQSEGLPLSIKDVKGGEWTFQFRFWPNNNSRMYVLEGVTPCIQSMQLQAGDTSMLFQLFLKCHINTCVLDMYSFFSVQSMQMSK